MPSVIDTSIVSPSERFELWIEGHRRAFACPFEHRLSPDSAFNGQLGIYDLGPVAVARVAADPSTLARTHANIVSGDPELLKFMVLLKGVFNVAEGERAAVLHPGEIVSLNSSCSWVIHAPSFFETISFAIPRSCFGAELKQVCTQTATPFTGCKGFGRIAATFLKQLVDGLAAGEIDGDVRLGNTVIELARSLHLSRIQPEQDARHRSKEELLLRVKAFIRANLGDPSLRPESIARAHFISTRLLYTLFEQEDLGVSEWIRTERLERCRRDLADPALRHKTILSIAGAWGLPDGSYFSRIFRETYGRTPREFRQEMAGAPRADSAQ